MGSSETRTTPLQEPVVLEGPVRQGTRLGRFLVLERIGSGGMAEVYSGYDPQLDRKIALKLLRPGRSEPAELVAEAKALGAVRHPNVIHVYDVGTHDGQVFLAMELVSGLDLRSKLREETGVPWRQRLRWALAAGRGIEAVHRQGLVHGDIKPANVLVDDDGHVRVSDFGLARPIDEPSSPSGNEVGGIRGTPAYLAPEQHAGTLANERTDVFQYAVMVWEVLYGERPYAAETSRLLATAKQNGPPPSPKNSTIPRQVYLELRRGLEPDPAKRRAHLQPMLRSLSRSMAPLRWPWVAVAVVGAGVLGAVVVSPADSVCEGAEAEIDPVWNAARALRVERAFEATGAPFAEAAAREVRLLLDGYSQDWSASHQDACLATQVHRDQTEELMQLRFDCLQRRLREVDALVVQFEQADAQSLLHAVEAADGLPDLSRCSDTLALREPLRAPPELEKDIERIELQLAELEALRLSGRYAAAIELGQEVLQRAQDVGHAPTTAETLLGLGWTLSLAGRNDDAVKLLQSATIQAELGRANALKARAWIRLTFVAAYEAGQVERGAEYADMASAVLKVAGQPRQELADLETVRGLLAHERGDASTAQKHHERALELYETLHGARSLRAAHAHNNLGQALGTLQQYDASRGHYAQALEIRKHRLGDAHPDVAQVLGNMSLPILRLGNREEAERLTEQSWEIRRDALGEEHPQTISAQINWARMLWAMEHRDDAIERATSAADAAARVHGPWHRRTLTAHNNLCAMLLQAERFDDALEVCGYTDGVELAPAVAAQPAVASLNLNYGLMLVHKEQFQRAERVFRRALGQTGPGTSRVRASLQAGLGEALYALGRAREAATELESSVEYSESDPDASAEGLAAHRLTLGKALWEAGDPIRGRAVVVDVLKRGASKSEDEARAWLADHP